MSIHPHGVSLRIILYIVVDVVVIFIVVTNDVPEGGMVLPVRAEGGDGDESSMCCSSSESWSVCGRRFER